MIKLYFRATVRKKHVKCVCCETQHKMIKCCKVLQGRMDGYMKYNHSILLVLEYFPAVEKVLKQQESKQSLNEQEQVMLELCLFFEKPDLHSFDMKEVYKLGDQDSIRFVFRAFQVFFEKDTYLFPLSDGESIIQEKQPIEYLNQTDFARYLNEQGISFTQNKLAVYRSRGKLPKEDMVISGRPYWMKETAEQYVREMKENQK